MIRNRFSTEFDLVFASLLVSVSFDYVDLSCHTGVFRMFIDVAWKGIGTVAC